MKRILLSIGAATVLFAANAQTRYQDEIFSSATKTHADVQYSIDGQPQNIQPQFLDVWEGAGDTATSRAAIIWVHGGTFIGGDKADSTLPGLNGDVTQSVAVTYVPDFAKRGYVSVPVNYSLATSYNQLLDSLSADSVTLRAGSDLKAAVRFLRENASTYGIDPNKIFLAGTEAGAVIAMNGVYLDTISKASPNLAGIINTLSPTNGLEGTGGHYGFSSVPNAVISLGGGVLEKSWIDGRTCIPALLVQADNNNDDDDYEVPYKYGQVLTNDGSAVSPAVSYLYGTYYIDQQMTAKNITHTTRIFVGVNDHDGEPWDLNPSTDGVTVDSLIETFLFAYATSGVPACSSTVGIKTIENDKALSVFPNPAQNVINISLEGVAVNEIQSVRLFNLLGQTVYSGKTTTISTQSLTNGMYLVEVSFKDNQRAVKRVEVAK